MERVYIITCGEYEDKHNEFVTNDIDKAVEFALSRYRNGIYYEDFNGIEVWENGVLICDYGSLIKHKVSSYAKEILSFSIFKEDLEKAIKEDF